MKLPTTNRHHSSQPACAFDDKPSQLLPAPTCHQRFAQHEPTPERQSACAAAASRCPCCLVAPRPPRWSRCQAGVTSIQSGASRHVTTAGSRPQRHQPGTARLTAQSRWSWTGWTRCVSGWAPRSTDACAEGGRQASVGALVAARQGGATKRRWRSNRAAQQQTQAPHLGPSAASGAMPPRQGQRVPCGLAPVGVKPAGQWSVLGWFCGCWALQG